MPCSYDPSGPPPKCGWRREHQYQLESRILRTNAPFDEALSDLTPYQRMRFRQIFLFPDNPALLEWYLKYEHTWGKIDCERDYIVPYDPSIDQYLPDPSDKVGMLRWIGLQDDAIADVLQRYNDKYRDIPEKDHPLPYTDWKRRKYPLLMELVKLFKDEVKREGKLWGWDQWVGDLEPTWDDDYTRASYLGLAPEYAAKMGTHREDVGLASNDWGYGRVVTRVYEAAELFARRLVKLWRDQISFRKRSHNKQDLEYKEDWHWAYKREEVETVWFPLEAFVDHYYEAGEDDRG